MVAAPQPPQPKGQSYLGSDHEARERLASTATYPPPVAEPAVRRQTPEVGAVCGKAARTDLCGGRPSNGRPYRNPIETRDPGGCILAKLQNELIMEIQA